MVQDYGDDSIIVMDEAMQKIQAILDWCEGVSLQLQIAPPTMA